MSDVKQGVVIGGVVVLLVLLATLALKEQVSAQLAREEAHMLRSEASQLRNSLDLAMVTAKECRLRRQSETAAIGKVLTGLGIDPQVMLLRWEIMAGAKK